jgi:hypothetical protein
MSEVTYRSPVAPHVYGVFGERDEDTGQQTVDITCEVCAAHCKCHDVCTCPAHWHTVCTSGQPRQHVSRFALVHLHRDAMASSSRFTGSGTPGTPYPVPPVQSPVKGR